MAIILNSILKPTQATKSPVVSSINVNNVTAIAKQDLIDDYAIAFTSSLEASPNEESWIYSSDVSRDVDFAHLTQTSADYAGGAYDKLFIGPSITPKTGSQFVNINLASRITKGDSSSILFNMITDDVPSNIRMEFLSDADRDTVFDEYTTAVDLATGAGTGSGGGGASLLTGNLLYVDNVNGDNGTGTPGDFSLPYETITAAFTAASSGDTVVIRPASYTESFTLKNGVKIFAFPGVLIDGTISSDATDSVIDIKGYLSVDATNWKWFRFYS